MAVQVTVFGVSRILFGLWRETSRRRLWFWVLRFRLMVKTRSLEKFWWGIRSTSAMAPSLDSGKNVVAETTSRSFPKRCVRSQHQS